MLLWLRNARKHISVWAQLIFFSSLAHAVVIFLLFFLYTGYFGQYKTYTISVGHKNNVEFVFLPLHKRCNIQSLASHTDHVVKQSINPIIKKKPKTAVAIKKGDAIKQKPVVEKKVVKQPVAQKKQKVKSKIPKKAVVARQDKKQQSVVEREKDLSVPVASTELEKIYVGQAEMDALQLQDSIEAVLQDQWHPPYGLRQDLLCAVRVVVDWNGVANNITLCKKSGVLVYDMSARNAVVAMKFPTCCRGKEFIMHFRS